MGKVLFLGVEGSGKSCLTAALASYFEAHAENGWSLRPENKEAFAFSTRMPKRLAAGELPAQTARFRHLRWSLCYKDEPQRTLDVLDYPGEVYRLAFLDPEDDPHPETLKARQTAHADEIRELMTFAKDADQIFVLFNLSDAKNLETDDQNIDAVWVTVQTLKILGSLESNPQLTLLITQADRLVREGEDVSDVNALLKKYAPIILSSRSLVSPFVISALNPENGVWGMKSLVRRMLFETELYKRECIKWQNVEDRIEEGHRIQRSEIERLMPIASAYAWVSELAGLVSDADGELTQYFRLQDFLDGVISKVPSLKEQILHLNAVDLSTWPAWATACRDFRVMNIKSNISDRNFGAVVICSVLGFFVLLLVLVVALSPR